MNGVAEIPEILLADSPPIAQRPGGEEAFLSLLRQIPLSVWQAFLSRKRWAGFKNEPIRDAGYRRLFWLTSRENAWALLFWEATTLSGTTVTYFLPLSLEPQPRITDPLWEGSWAIARLRSATRVFLLSDALGQDRFCQAFLCAWLENTKSSSWDGQSCLLWEKGSSFPPSPKLLPVQRPSWEQSHTSLVFGNEVLLKCYRKIEPGKNPEEEFAHFFHNASPCPHVASWLGSVTCRLEKGGEQGVAIAFEYLPEGKDGWSYTLELLREWVKNPLPEKLDLCRSWAGELGRVLFSVHKALSETTGSEAFDPEPLAPQEIKDWKQNLQKEWEETVQLLRFAETKFTPEEKELLEQFFSIAPRFSQTLLQAIPQDWQCRKCRFHGDLHLGQILVTPRGLRVLDWEGEPDRPIAERRRKGCLVKDVAGLLRSFFYLASFLAYEEQNKVGLSEKMAEIPGEVGEAFLARYWEKASLLPTLPRDTELRNVLLGAFCWQKALYELRYECNHRPSWIRIALQSVLWYLKSPFVSFTNEQ
ncbi:phosphotransferase [Candidatus Methylacidithermus pantelleriae]|uniref:Aminoglycoside phosphotransferase domain-containing protein n=1 Tax=Candidatus Methylacidithermus pantelleriae TaxID=2744239 RepID=A0A8J2BQT8_9BACT|nr:phosphotransferase [Candidatus Methylacidithermus pantelleriae]CAF0691447.1 hypothetical protein MPNT_100049 [Candidatus Methylacidithermus pantelleriae]